MMLFFSIMYFIAVSCLLGQIENEPTLKVSQLKEKAETRVSELTSGRQKPTSRKQTLEFDWEVW